jgi:hypothetical protein
MNYLVRWTFIVMALTAAALLVATLAAWPRSFRRADAVSWSHGDRAYGVHSECGTVTFGRGVAITKGEFDGSAGWNHSTEESSAKWSAIAYESSPWRFRGFAFHQRDIPSRLGTGVGFVVQCATIPFWAVALFWSGACLLCSVPEIRRCRIKRRLKIGRCPVCGYDRRATPDRCPECGDQKVGRP